MANLSKLRDDISQKWGVKSNGTQAITGDKLKGAMLDVIDTLNDVKTDQDVFNREKQALSQGLENQGTQIQEQGTKLSELELKVNGVETLQYEESLVKQNEGESEYILSFTDVNISIGETFSIKVISIVDPSFVSIYNNTESATAQRIGRWKNTDGLLSGFYNYGETINFIANTDLTSLNVRLYGASGVSVKIILIVGEAEIGLADRVDDLDARTTANESAIEALQENVVSDIHLKSYSIKTFDEKFGYGDYSVNTPFASSRILTSNCEVEESVVKFRDEKTLKATLHGSTQAYVRYIFDSMSNVGIQEFEVPIYIDNPSLISDIFLGVSTLSSSRDVYNKNALVTGWNMLRFNRTGLSKGVFAGWDAMTTLFLNIVTSDTAEILIGQIRAIVPGKAKILFVDDHAYHDFKEYAYPQLKALGIPVTWATQPNRLGTPIASAGTLLTEDDVLELAADAMSEISWHTFDGEDAILSHDDRLSYFQKAQSALRRMGVLAQYPWRAAWKQNNAPNALLCKDLIDGFAYFEDPPVGYTTDIESLPFSIDQYHICRKAIHRGLSDTDDYYHTNIDNLFNKLRVTHGLAVFYTHGYIDTESQIDVHIMKKDFDYFLAKVEEGVNDGWLEGVTYNQLRIKYGKLWD